MNAKESEEGEKHMSCDALRMPAIKKDKQGEYLPIVVGGNNFKIYLSKT